MAIAAVFFLVGLVALIRGVSLISVPWAWVVFGLACVFLSLWPVLRGRFLRP